MSLLPMGSAALARVESWLLSATGHATRWTHQVSWRLGPRARAASGGLHEVVLSMAARRGWLDVGAQTLAAALGTPLKHVPDYPGFAPRGPAPTPRARGILDGVYTLETGGHGRVAELSWRADPYGPVSRLARLRFHALDWVEDLLDAHQATGERRYLDAARDLVRGWIDDALLAQRSGEIWSDHATALRAVTLTRLWAASRDAGVDAAFMGRLLGALRRHARRLAHPAIYRADHNHGVTQAYALFALALCLPSLAEAPGWSRLGRERLEAQMAENVSAEGLHREHSPYYHFYVLQHFWAAVALAEAWGVELGAAFHRGVADMARAGACLVKPDGSLAALGDTSRASPVLVDLADTQPPAASALFTGAGYAVLRQGPTGPEQAVVVLRLATFPTAHVHRDVGTFELSALGGNLIVDTGGPYAYRDPFRPRYVTATWGHSTVVVDEGDQAIGAGRVLHWQAGDDAAAIVVEHETYPGVRHRRVVALLPGPSVLVIDRLVADRPRRFSQLFHLDPALDGALDGAAVVTSRRDAGPTLRVLALRPEGVEAELVRGREQPPQGWVCTGEHARVPAVTIEYRRQGVEAVFATLLVPERAGALPSMAVLEGEPLAGAARLDVRQGSRRWEAALTPGGAVTVLREPEAGRS